MLKIRMQRIGRRNQPSYRVVVIDSRLGPKSGRFIEKIGYYNPLVKECRIDKDRVLYWRGKGAQLSDTTHNLCVANGIIEGEKKNVLPKHTPIKKEEPEVPTPPAEETPDEKEQPQEELPEDTTETPPTEK